MICPIKERTRNNFLFVIRSTSSFCSMLVIKLIIIMKNFQVYNYLRTININNAYVSLAESKSVCVQTKVEKNMHKCMYKMRTIMIAARRRTRTCCLIRLQDIWPRCCWLNYVNKNFIVFTLARKFLEHVLQHEYRETQNSFFLMF